jgi:hypothetical protein
MGKMEILNERRLISLFFCLHVNFFDCSVCDVAQALFLQRRPVHPPRRPRWSCVIFVHHFDFFSNGPAWRGHRATPLACSTNIFSPFPFLLNTEASGGRARRRRSRARFSFGVPCCVHMRFLGFPLLEAFLWLRACPAEEEEHIFTTLLRESSVSQSPNQTQLCLLHHRPGFLKLCS